ncbi:unnamed protein product [Amoebophrya sp. A25]|nr:unnamed protein product [Amoebophrya sp. A25]|eukprot:GSA25T00025773001.1
MDKDSTPSPLAAMGGKKAELRTVDTQLLEQTVPTADELRAHGGAFRDTKRDTVRANAGLGQGAEGERKKQDGALHNQPDHVRRMQQSGSENEGGKKKGKNKVAPAALDLSAAAEGFQGDGMDPQTPIHDRVNAHRSVSRPITPREGIMSSAGGKTKSALKKAPSGGHEGTQGSESENKTGTGASSSFRQIRDRTAKLKELRRQARINTGTTLKGRQDRVQHQRNEGRSFRKGYPQLNETVEFTLERCKQAYKIAEDEARLTKRALRMREKGQKMARTDNNSPMKMVATFSAVVRAIFFYHLFPGLNDHWLTVFFLGRVLPAVEIGIQFCEPQLGHSMGRMCPYDPGYDGSADVIDPVEGVPKGEPMMDSFPFAAQTFGIALPWLAILWVWYRCIPYIFLRVLSNRSLVIGFLLLRSVLTVKRSPSSVQTGMGIDGNDSSLIIFTYSSWFMLGLPLIVFIDLIVLVAFFPLRTAPNFLSAAKFFLRQMMLVVGSPSYMLFDIILINSEGPGGPRDTFWAKLGLGVSMATWWFTALRVSQVAFRNLITMWEVICLSSRMGRGTTGESISQVQKVSAAEQKKADERVFPPFFIVLVQMDTCSLEREKYVLNENEVAQFGYALFNNIYVENLVLPASCCKNLVKAAYTLFDAIEHCVIVKDNCMLRTFNWFSIKDVLQKANLVYSMDRYRYGHEKLNLPFEMTFKDSGYYLVAGERVQRPWTDLEAIVFCRMMTYNGNLLHLDLSSNLIKDYGFMALAEFLFCNSQLKTLNVSNNDLDGLQDKTLDTLMDSIVSHPRLEKVQFSATTMAVPLREFEDAEVLRWDAYNVYTINISMLVQNIVDFVTEHQLIFDYFPPKAQHAHYSNVLEAVVANDMNLSRQLTCSVHPELRRFVIERVARKCGHPMAPDPQDLLDIYTDDSKKIKRMTKTEKARRDTLLVPPKERVKISVLGPLEGMCMAMTLRMSRFLREVYLEGNRIRDRGAEMFFRLLCEPGNVVEILSLANCDIGYARNNYVKGRAVKWLQRVLTLPDMNPRLTQIDLFQNAAFVAFEREIRVWVMTRPQTDEVMPMEVNVKRGK